jgi:hypothetical protein
MGTESGTWNVERTSSDAHWMSSSGLSMVRCAGQASGEVRREQEKQLRAVQVRARGLYLDDGHGVDVAVADSVHRHRVGQRVVVGRLVHNLVVLRQMLRRLVVLVEVLTQGQDHTTQKHKCPLHGWRFQTCRRATRREQRRRSELEPQRPQTSLGFTCPHPFSSVQNRLFKRHLPVKVGFKMSERRREGACTVWGPGVAF